jgi:hypothetical protein
MEGGSIMTVPTEEQDRRNAAEALRKQLWSELSQFVLQTAGDVFKRDKPEALSVARDYLARIERLNGWAKP